MSTTVTLSNARWAIGRAIRQSSLNEVNKTEFRIFICNWGQCQLEVCDICEEVRDMLRGKQRNAFVPGDFQDFLGSRSTDLSREELFRRAARTSNAVLIIYNEHISSGEIGQTSNMILSEFTPNVPKHIRNRVKPMTFCREEKVCIPSMPNDWSTVQPRFTEVSKLLAYIRRTLKDIRYDAKNPGHYWYENEE